VLRSCVCVKAMYVCYGHVCVLRPCMCVKVMDVSTIFQLALINGFKNNTVTN
jgi:hypothetical protein